ncbi:hypothetical protein C8F01DRAFT_1183047 [Mycena amicta]|nr:hypothetical protein C8F01DRAFT_1183047 [Mycena amicta]
MARDAYESDTGERDIPTVDNFLKRQPMKRVIEVPRGRRNLNRTGRAIARIVHANGYGQHKAVGVIFGVGKETIRLCVSKSEYKQRYPHDELKNDYDYAGEDFRKHFPALEKRLAEADDSEEDCEEKKKKPAQRLLTCQRRKVKKRRRHSVPSSSSESESNDEPAVRSPSSALSTPPREDLIPATNLPPSVSTPGPASPASFQQTLGLSGTFCLTPARIALLDARGLTMQGLYTVAQWTDAEISNAMPRLLLEKIDDHVPMDVFEVVMLEIALRKLRVEAAPPPTQTIHTAASLRAFLPAVHGFNLVVHLPFFLAQGFTLERLRILSTVPAASLCEILACGLQRGGRQVQVSGGLSQLEVIALEFALRV